MRPLWIGLALPVALVGSLLLPPSAVGAPTTPTQQRVPSQIQPTKYPLKWSRATLDDKVALDKLGRRPIVDPEQVTWLLACENDRQLDCVESIGLVSTSGAYEPGRWVRGITRDMTGRPAEGIEPYSRHWTVWDIPGLEVNGESARIFFEGGGACWARDSRQSWPQHGYQSLRRHKHAIHTE
jgi:hypothetical protein